MGISKFPTISLGYTFHTPAGSKHAQWTCHSPYNVLFFSYPSDLMKSTVVDESLSSNQLQFCVPEKINLLQIIIIIIHSYIALVEFWLLVFVFANLKEMLV